MDDAVKNQAAPPRPLPPVNPADFYLERGYVSMPEDVARSHPLFGVAGWTVALGVLLILDVIVGVFNTFVLFSLVSRAGWVVLFALFQAGMMIWLIACIAKLFGRKRDFPSQLTALCTVNLIYVIVIALIAGFTWMTFVQIGVVALYISYVQRSRRVHVTYLNQAEPSDPFLAEVFPHGVPEALKPAPRTHGAGAPDAVTYRQAMAKLRGRSAF